MKKNSLILFLILGITAPLASMKRANPEEEIKEEKEPKRQRPEDAPKSPTPAAEPIETVKEIPKQVTLKVPVSGSNQTIDEVVDLVETRDAVGADSLYNLIGEAIKEKQGFILARVPTCTGEKQHVEYYELDNLHKSLFNRALFPANPDAVLRYTLLTPQRAPICGSITYFAFSTDTSQFRYFSNDYELIKVRPPLQIQTVNAYYGPPANRINAMLGVAKQYENQKSYSRALYWYEKASQLGNSTAMHIIGNYYEYGFGMAKPDLQKAMEWYEKASKFGKNEEKFLKQIYIKLWNENPKVENNQKILEKAAALNEAWAMSLLASLYSSQKNYVKSYELLQDAAKLGDGVAMNQLAYNYQFGLGIEKPDYQKAHHWYEQATAKNYYPAMNNLGYLYHHGLGLDKPNYQKAFELYTQVAAQNLSPALFHLGELYEDGLGVTKDYQKALEWYEKALKAEVNDMRKETFEQKIIEIRKKIAEQEKK